MNRFIVGAYTTAPSLGGGSEIEERDFYQGLTEKCPYIRGLEIPFWGDALHQFGSDFLYEMMDDSWESVVTCIPGTMAKLSSDKHFGLASEDDGARQRAVAMHKRANDLIYECNKYFGRQAIFAVQIATSPSVPVEGVSSSPIALEESLEEILLWDWYGARVVIEHCDFSEGTEFEKGFLSLDDEISVLKEFSSEYSLGIVVNWARSAIEGRSVDKPVEHLVSLQKSGLLNGVIFSGVSDRSISYGKWKDTHAPFARSLNVENYEEDSLLTYENLTNSLNAIDIRELEYLGIKLLVMPTKDSSLERRVGVSRDAMVILNNALNLNAELR